MKILIWITTYFVGFIVMVLGDLLFALISGGRFAMGYLFDLGIFALCGVVSHKLCCKWSTYRQRKQEIIERRGDCIASSIKIRKKVVCKNQAKRLTVKHLFLIITIFFVSFALFFTIVLLILPEIEKTKTEKISTYTCYITKKNNHYHNLSCTDLDGVCTKTNVFSAKESGYTKCPNCDTSIGKEFVYERTINYVGKDYVRSLIISLMITIFAFLIFLLVYYISHIKHNRERNKIYQESNNSNLISKMVFAKSINNASRLLNICRDLIDKYEGEDSMIPSCKDDLMESIEDQVCSSKEEISQWKDFDTDYIRIAHTMLANTSFDLLASGTYNLYTGMLNPMKCGQQLLKVYDSSMKWAVERKEIDETTRIEQREYLMKCISQVG